MTEYKLIKGIDRIDDIPWDVQIIITGSIGKNHWSWKMPGIFQRNNGNPRFLNECGIATYFNESDVLRVNILEAVK